MADFTIPYEKYIKPAEGGYVNNVFDKGGETYAGIARNFFPTWSGWAYIDEQKKFGDIKRNTKFPTIQDKVDNFYKLAFWDKGNFGDIQNQDVANILFDWFVNSGSNAAGTTGTETYGVDEILNRDFGFHLAIDKKFDPLTIKAINSVDPVKLYNIIKKERINFYNQLVKNDPSQSVFINGWMNRINSFPDAVKIAGGIGLFLVIVLCVTLIFLK